ncbi:hypothetical protein CFC21_050397 [Triticum aestivum]|uniref:Uncharacterized protein n=3 Tax=Triticinae TaxID=1648030 RepID=A0A3B6H3W8_WHEAT|nr:hypothetical protein CFC21_050397 [Triticum aestivum]
MGFCCGPSDVKVLPKNHSLASSPSPSAKESSGGGKKKQPQGVKKEGKEKKRGNLDRAAMASPRLPFHSRPGLM